MKHRIDPKIDCVFKALLGAERNRRLLIHFINAILADELTTPLVEVEILNPYNEREFLDDKLSIVDVKARDPAGRVYQIEIQLLNVADLPARILYGWADLYSAQLQAGEDYNQLKPTYSIWLLGQTLRPKLTKGVHRFHWRDDQGQSLIDHGGIWLLELSKIAIEAVNNEQERWLKFFVEGDRLDDEHLPAWMDTEEMQQAMSTLKAFSEKTRAYHQYQARQNYLRQQRSIQNHLNTVMAQSEQVQTEKAQAQAERDQAQAERDQAQAERDQVQAERDQVQAERDQVQAERDQVQVERDQVQVERDQVQVERDQVQVERDQALAEIERLKALIQN